MGGHQVGMSLSGLSRRKEKLIRPTLQTTLIQRSQFDNGYVEGALSQSAQVLWENAWAAVKSA